MQISTYTLEQFQEAFDRSIPIHDLDIKRWALKARSDNDLSPTLFTASAKWIHQFKLRHRIVSLKINKFVTQKQIKNKEELKKEALEFVQNVKLQINEIVADAVYKTDQSGFNLKMHTGRALSYKRNLKVEAIAQSLNSLTHSYTIQPIISASGQLLSPLLTVLKEKNGRFGSVVQKNLYKADNIAVSPSDLGKLTSNMAKLWFKTIYLPHTAEKIHFMFGFLDRASRTKFRDRKQK